MEETKNSRALESCDCGHREFSKVLLICNEGRNMNQVDIGKRHYQIFAMGADEVANVLPVP